jgi:hypothetical protein
MDSDNIEKLHSQFKIRSPGTGPSRWRLTWTCCKPAWGWNCRRCGFTTGCESVRNRPIGGLERLHLPGEGLLGQVCGARGRRAVRRGPVRRHHCLAPPPQGSDPAPGKGSEAPVSRSGFGFTVSGSYRIERGDAHHDHETDDCQPHGEMQRGNPEIVFKKFPDLHGLSCLPASR